MKRIKNIRVCIALVAVFSFVSQNAGAEIDKLTYDSGSWSVQGSFRNTSDTKAAAEILKPGKTVNDSDPYADTTEFDVDAEGNFSGNFRLNGESGEYLLRVGANGQIFERNFLFINDKELAAYLSLINNASSAEELAEVFEKDYGRLKNICGMDIKSGDKAYVYGSIYKSIPSGGFTSFDEVKKTVAEVVLLKEFMTATDDKTSKLEKLFDYFDDKYLPAVEVWKDTQITDDTIRTAVAGSLQKSDIATIASLQTEFCENILSQDLSKEGSKGRELSLLKIAHSLFDFSEYTYFSGLSEAKQISILSDIPSGSGKSVAVYSSAFDKAVKAYRSNNNNNKSGGGSSGGGGGSSSGGGSAQKGYTPVNNTTATPTPQPAANGDFTDIDGYDWAKAAIEKLHRENVLNGKASGVFAPADQIKREEFTQIIIKACKLGNDNDAYDGFSDVKAGDWFYRTVSSAVVNKIVNGISDTEFGVGQNITRQDAAMICERAATALGFDFGGGGTETNLQYATKVDKDPFSDQEEIADYAKDAVTNLHNAGVVNGRDNNEFKPVDYITRAESAVLVDKLMKIIDISSEQLDDKDKKMAAKFSAFGMYSGEANGMNEEITRAEAAELLSGFIKLPAGTVDGSITDCSEDSASAKAIYSVCKLGYMNTTDNKFSPTDVLAFDEAVRMAVLSLGAGWIAENVAGTTDECYRIAVDKGILSGVTKTDGNSVTKRDFFRMFYNIFDEYVYIADYSNGKADYKDTGDKTFLENYFNVSEDKGKMTANSDAGIAGDTAVKNTVKIDGKEFDCTNKEYQNYLGRDVRYYYKEDTNKDNVIVYMEETGKSQVKTLTSSQIDKYENLKYTYSLSDDSQSDSIDITNTVNVVYNTQTVYDYNDDMLDPKSGTVTFVDADGDGKYTKEDTLIINSYMNIVVGSINKANKIIYDKYTVANGGSDYTLDLNKVVDYEIKDKHGDVFGLSELREWDVLAVVLRPDRSHAEITLVDEAYAGKVTSIYDTEITIDKNTYKLGKDWRGTADFVKAGKDVTVYWDLLGRVVAIEEGISASAQTAEGSDSDTSQVTQKLAVLVNHGTSEEGEEKQYISTYYSDDKVSYNELKSKVKVNGTQYKSNAIDGILDGQLGKAILIKINQAGEVTEIITAAQPGQDKTRGLWLITYDNESLIYKDNTKNFGGRFILGSSVYTIPKSKSDYGDHELFAYNNAKFVTDHSYILDAYTTKWQSVLADAVVYTTEKNATSAYNDDTAYVISNIETRLNDDDESCLYLDGFDYSLTNDNVQMKSYQVDTEAVIVDVNENIRKDITLKDLEAGDCIRYGISNGKINTIMLAYDSSEGKVSTNTGSRSGYTYAGDAYSLSDDKKYLTITDGTDPSTIDVSSYENGGKHLQSFGIRKESLITVVDKTGKKVAVRSGTAADILTYVNAGSGCSKVVMYSDWQSWIWAIVVYVE